MINFEFANLNFLQNHFYFCNLWGARSELSKTKNAFGDSGAIPPEIMAQAEEAVRQNYIAAMQMREDQISSLEAELDQMRAAMR